jgi:hypothetical protein
MGSSTSLATGEATVDLDFDESITCTFVVADHEIFMDGFEDP